MPEIVQAREFQVKNARTICRLALILLIISAAFSGLKAQDASPSGNATVITRGADFANIDALMNAAVARGSIPGGVVLIGHNGRVVYRKAYGMR